MGLDVAHRLELVEERIEAACRRSGRKREELKLMGVTKSQSLETVEAAWNAGIRLFGESRVLEGREKFIKFREARGWNGNLDEKINEKFIEENFELHLIGSLQRNKAKTAAAFFDCIQSVDRDSLIGELGALTAGRDSPLSILLEYHTGEETKAGFPDLDSLFKAAEMVLSFPGLRPLGLMTMAPFTTDTAIIRASFRKLTAARDELVKRFSPGINSANWSCLSMGMTNDYEIAIEEGATLIRIGTAIFGEGRT